MMPRADDHPVLAGVAHRALETLSMLIYEYDELGVTTQILRAGAIFVPSAPQPRWHGEKVLISLGESTAPFAWCADAPRGHFLRWDDFFGCCAPRDTINAKAIPRLHEQPLACPFAELPAIGERLRRKADTPGKRTVIDACLTKLKTIQAAYASAAEMQLGSEGFDNTERAAHYAAEKARLLSEAKEALARTRALVNPRAS